MLLQEDLQSDGLNLTIKLSLAWHNVFLTVLMILEWLMIERRQCEAGCRGGRLKICKLLIRVANDALWWIFCGVITSIL